ncbi:hypothetical protein M900_A0006 [Bacteriovorax sp. Seq25_V]|nr:hypothetical protein M900_A0006 [Bacteriovorax sp. Seq25_V]
MNLQKYGLMDSSWSLNQKQTALSLIVFFIFRFYCSLFLKKSLGHLFSGLSFKGHDNLQTRVSVCLRSLALPLFIILLPLDIFLSKFDKKPVSDMIFGTELRSSNSVLSLIFAPALSLMLIGSAYFAPFLYNASYLLRPKVSVVSTKEVPISKKRNFDLFENYGSKSLLFMTFTDLDEGRFKVNPSYEIRRTKGSLIYRPIVSIWDKSLGLKGIFKINKRFDFYKLIKIVKDNYPLFDSFYPVLSREFNEFANITEDKEDLSISPVAQNELFELLTNSLLATPLGSLELLKKGRINIFPYLILKDRLFTLLGKENSQEIDFVQRGDELFIRTIFQDDFSDQYRERFFTYNELRPVIYEIVWEKNRFDKEVSEVFSANFFYKAKWGSKVIEESKQWEKDYLFNPISIVDFIGFKDFSPNGLKSFEKYLQDYYYQEGKDSFNQSSEYQKLFIASMQRIFVVWQLKMKESNVPFSKVTVKKYTDMMRALQLNDVKFFGVVDDKSL